MTAPAWTVAEVSGMPTLLRDGQPVAYLDDGKLHVSPMSGSHVFDLLTRVLAPDEATVERLAREVTARIAYDEDVVVTLTHREIEAALAALAGTSAQARHTTDDVTGGGEHG